MRAMLMLTVFALAPYTVLTAEDDDKVKKDMAVLEGDWTMTKGISDGNEVPDEIRKTAKRSFKDGVSTVEINGNVTMKAKITIDPAAKVKTIDYDVIEGQLKDKKVLGIYEISGDEVKFCFAQPGADRPTAFESKAGSKQVFSVWTKKK
jgi:uncharacterized protein (TIGR03067 family)